MQAGATGRHRPFPEKRASFTRLQVQARHQARPARREVRHAHVRLRQPAARKAEAAPHVRHARAAVPPLFRARPRAARARPAKNLLHLLESRLDNVVYRMGFGSTRAEARQIVGHRLDHGERQGREHSVGDGQGEAMSSASPRRPRASCASRIRCSSPRRSASRRGSMSTSRRCPARSRVRPTVPSSVRTSTKAWWSSCIRSNPPVSRFADSLKRIPHAEQCPY